MKKENLINIFWMTEYTLLRMMAKKQAYTRNGPHEPFDKITSRDAMKCAIKNESVWCKESEIS